MFALRAPKNGATWTEEMLHRFDGQDGATPAAGVVFGGNGDLFGTAYAGAIRGNGAVFDLAAPKAGEGLWKETLLYRFSSNTPGANPEAALTFDKLGNLYSTTHVGSVFRLLQPKKKGGNWTLNSLHRFLGPPDGYLPAASLLFDKNGDLYSTTQAGGTGTGCRGGCGTVFEVSP